MNEVRPKEWVWLNGVVQPLADARMGLEDRGFQFADGVYEVIRIDNGRSFTLAQHLDRLKKSAEGILVKLPLDMAELTSEIEKLITRSGLVDGMIYLQLTRGQAIRNHEFPDTRLCKPTLLFFARALPPAPAAETARGVKLLTAPDDRWKRCWIKSIALLPNVLAKNAAIAAGGDEAIFVDDGILTECAASNFYAVINGGIVTHPIGPKVLPGITRLVVSELAADLGIGWSERPLSLDEARKADELFITSTTRELNWVTQWDGRSVAQACGAITQRLHVAFQQRVRRETTQGVAQNTRSTPKSTPKLAPIGR